MSILTKVPFRRAKDCTINRDKFTKEKNQYYQIIEVEIKEQLKVEYNGVQLQYSEYCITSPCLKHIMPI